VTAPLVEFENVTCRYGATTVLEDINLHLQKGQFAGVLGPSGAGKTTLLKAILGLHTTACGSVRVGGQIVRGRPSGRVGYVPQMEAVDWNFPLTVEQAVLMGRTRRAGVWPWPSRAERVLAQAVMERLGIAEFSQRHIRELSGGQQQRVFLARALIAEPELLVLDEPTAGIDLRTQEDILHLLADLNRDGVTVLLTTHDLNAAAAHLPWVICLNCTIMAQGTPEEVFVPETLNATFRGDMLVVRQHGLIFVQERPHGHSYHDITAQMVALLPPHPSEKADGAANAVKREEAARGHITSAV
jgi:ABC-type Mn2+/Zn2+ transport system ATPase subunit